MGTENVDILSPGDLVEISEPGVGVLNRLQPLEEWSPNGEQGNLLAG